MKMSRKKLVRSVGLTPDEKLRVAYFHLIEGIDQHVLAAIFKVNAGRVAEAVKAVRSAVLTRSSDTEEKIEAAQ